eukprot:5549422-Pyramimonas_sp.AAC.1
MAITRGLEQWQPDKHFRTPSHTKHFFFRSHNRSSTSMRMRKWTVKVKTTDIARGLTVARESKVRVRVELALSNWVRELFDVVTDIGCSIGQIFITRTTSIHQWCNIFDKRYEHAVSSLWQKTTHLADF